MFGISFPEMTIILIVAVIALGPDKLPKAMYEIAKIFKILKKTVNDAKSGFEQELKIAELKEDAKKYKESFTKTSNDIRKKLTFEELDEIKNNLNSAKDKLNNTTKTINDALNAPLQSVQDSLKNTSSSGDKVSKNMDKTAETSQPDTKKLDNTSSSQDSSENSLAKDNQNV
ncbi:MAG: Sec-independent protein translocase protein TatB [Campylobacter sp.]|nr:Sec-independent protein translocase protein TatB [Campylobacter sp.]